MKISPRSLTIGITAAAMVAGAGLVAGVNAYAAAGCRVNYSIVNTWPGGFGANVEVTNLGDPINGWNLVWTFTAGQRVTQMWNATYTQPATVVTATNVSYNNLIPTNGMVSFGFNGSQSGSNPVPPSFALNGTTCNGNVGSPSPSVSPSRSTSPSPSISPSSPPPGNAMAVVAAMQPGWNLGNSLDSTGSDETSWGNPRITQTLINNVKAQGFKSIRIPVTWGHHQGGAPSYTLEAAYLTRVKEVVDWALAADLYVMINVHHDSWEWVANMPGDRTNVLNRFNATWTQVANTFRTSSAKLLFESLNEPQFSSGTDPGNAPLLNELNTNFHRIVRASGGNNATRLLVLPTIHTNTEQASIDALASTMTALNDRNLVATFHFYGFWPFSVNIAGFTTFNAEVQADLQGQFDRMANAFISRNIPVILGEYGLLGFDRSTGTIEQGEKLKFFEHLGFYARTKRITTMLWDNGQHFGRTSFQWSDPELINQIKSSWTVRSGTASSDLVFSARASAITAKSLTLNLNGATVTAVRQGSTNLAQGSDYTVSGSTITFTAAAITRLSGSRAYGVNASVNIVFSQGVPWRVSFVTFDPPTMSNASGGTNPFTLPTTFRGDQLATMEAKYADGSNAGPQNWTSFKEFDFTFTPNYSAGNIALKQEFFNEVNNGARVTLTFHFWSGTRVTYFVTKNGSAVTGATS
ncbi:MAG TPA: cellulase family glycosylhydrolase [Candidatus Limnocylindrales bacterium]|nr:cellulase family glycosylhydrolase [Candidatus Limnocylindrales bacterium]